MEGKYLVTAVREVTGAPGCYVRIDVLGGFDTERGTSAL
jgi:hypothetical protein